MKKFALKSAKKLKNTKLDFILHYLPETFKSLSKQAQNWCNVIIKTLKQKKMEKTVLKFLALLYKFS